MTIAPKWRRQPGERPQQILSAALRVFQRNGFRGATVDQIAREAGITKGTVYLYFETKEALFIETVRAQFRRVYDLLPAITLDGVEDPEEATRRVGKEFMRALMSEEVAVALPLILAEVPHLPAIKRIYQEEILPLAGMQLAQLLEVGMAMGFIRPMNPVIAARCLFGMFLVFVVSQEVLGAKEVTPMDPDEIVDTLVDIYFRGILK
jgi:AcrR family transcriptional regulator